MLTLRDILPHFSNRKSKVASALGISRQAVSKWDLNEAIPEKHELRIRHELLPDIDDSVTITAAELPTLDVLSETVAAHYRLEVMIQGGAYRLRLVPIKPDMPTLGLSDTGAGVEATAPELGSAI